MIRRIPGLLIIYLFPVLQVFARPGGVTKPNLEYDVMPDSVDQLDGKELLEYLNRTAQQPPIVTNWEGLVNDSASIHSYDTGITKTSNNTFSPPSGIEVSPRDGFTSTPERSSESFAFYTVVNKRTTAPADYSTEDPEADSVDGSRISPRSVKKELGNFQFTIKKRDDIRRVSQTVFVRNVCDERPFQGCCSYFTENVPSKIYVQNHDSLGNNETFVFPVNVKRTVCETKLCTQSSQRLYICFQKYKSLDLNVVDVKNSTIYKGQIEDGCQCNAFPVNSNPASVTSDIMERNTERNVVSIAFVGNGEDQDIPENCKNLCYVSSSFRQWAIRAMGSLHSITQSLYDIFSSNASSEVVAEVLGETVLVLNDTAERISQPFRINDGHEKPCSDKNTDPLKSDYSQNTSSQLNVTSSVHIPIDSISENLNITTTKKPPKIASPFSHSTSTQSQEYLNSEENNRPVFENDNSEQIVTKFLGTTQHTLVPPVGNLLSNKTGSIEEDGYPKQKKTENVIRVIGEPQTLEKVSPASFIVDTSTKTFTDILQSVTRIYEIPYEATTPVPASTITITINPAKVVVEVKTFTNTSVLVLSDGALVTRTQEITYESTKFIEKSTVTYTPDSINSNTILPTKTTTESSTKLPQRIGGEVTTNLLLLTTQAIKQKVTVPYTGRCLKIAQILNITIDNAPFRNFFCDMHSEIETLSSLTNSGVASCLNESFVKILDDKIETLPENAQFEYKKAALALYGVHYVALVNRRKYRLDPGISEYLPFSVKQDLSKQVWLWRDFAAGDILDDLPDDSLQTCLEQAGNSSLLVGVPEDIKIRIQSLPDVSNLLMAVVEISFCVNSLNQCGSFISQNLTRRLAASQHIGRRAEQQSLDVTALVESKIRLVQEVKESLDWSRDINRILTNEDFKDETLAHLFNYERQLEPIAHLFSETCNSLEAPISGKFLTSSQRVIIPLRLASTTPGLHNNQDDTNLNTKKPSSDVNFITNTDGSDSGRQIEVPDFGPISMDHNLVKIILSRD